MQTQSNQPPSIKIRRTRQQWRAIVTEFEHCGLGMRTFCEQHDLAYSSFAKWRSLLKRENNDPKTQPVSFIQLPETAVGWPDSPWHIELDLGAGVTLRLTR